MSEEKTEEPKRDREKENLRKQALEGSKSARDTSRERRHAENLGDEDE